EDLVRDIAHFDPDVVEPDLIAYRAGELGYDLAVPLLAVVMDLVAPPDQADGGGRSTARLALLQTLRAAFSGANDIVAAMPSDRFVALHRVGSARPDDGHRDALRTLCARAVDEIGRRHGLTAAVGVGDIATTVIALH